jgi:hypothetical protein
LKAEANVQGQKRAVAERGSRSSIPDDEAEVTHSLNTAELETEAEDVKLRIVS